MGRLLQRLIVCLAFALAVLTPALARAALVPACEAHDQLTRMPVEWAPVEPSMVRDAADACDAGSVALTAVTQPAADELGDTRVAAMCDDRGASMIAPQRILPMTDARIEAAPGCETDESGPFVGRAPRHPPMAAAGPALADHAVIDAQVLVPAASSEAAPSFLPLTEGPRPGHDRGIDHPPR